MEREYYILDENSRYTTDGENDLSMAEFVYQMLEDGFEMKGTNEHGETIFEREEQES